jgi:diaminopimelate decarboxylase
VLAAGGRADRVLFSGVGKSDARCARRSPRASVLQRRERAEIERLDRLAARRAGRPVSLRHQSRCRRAHASYISKGLAGNKFGIPHDHAREAYGRAARMPNLRVTRESTAISGSQILEAAPLDEALERVLDLVRVLRDDGIVLGHVDLGGGFRHPVSRRADRRHPRLLPASRRPPGGKRLAAAARAGRAIAGNAGLLLTRVEYLKLDKAKRSRGRRRVDERVDRPALYGALADIVAVGEAPGRESATYDVVGPVCESSDVLGIDRTLAIAAGDLVAILSAGAYGMAMSSNYNTRPGRAEVLVDGESALEVRAREPLDSLFALETRLPSS